MCIFKDCIWPKTRSGKLERNMEEIPRHSHRGERGSSLISAEPRVCWGAYCLFQPSFYLEWQSISLGHWHFSWMGGPEDIWTAAWPGKTTITAWNAPGSTTVTRSQMAPQWTKLLHPQDQVPAQPLLIKCLVCVCLCVTGTPLVWISSIIILQYFSFRLQTYTNK